MISQLLILVAALGSVTALVGPLAFYWDGWDGLGAATAAVVVCLLSGLLAILATSRLQRPELAAYHVLVAMAFRTGIPLAFVLVAHTRGGPLVDTGFVYYLLVFYCAMMLAEVSASVSGRSGGPSGAGKAS